MRQREGGLSQALRASGVGGGGGHRVTTVSLGGGGGWGGSPAGWLASELEHGDMEAVSYQRPGERGHSIYCYLMCPNPHKGGVFAQRGHGANHYGVHPGNTPCKPPTFRSVHDPFKTASGVQNSGPWDPWLPGGEKQPTFRTARARRAHSARCAPKVRYTRTPKIRTRPKTRTTCTKKDHLGVSGECAKDKDHLGGVTGKKLNWNHSPK